MMMVEIVLFLCNLELCSKKMYVKEDELALMDTMGCEEALKCL